MVSLSMLRLKARRSGDVADPAYLILKFPVADCAKVAVMTRKAITNNDRNFMIFFINALIYVKDIIKIMVRRPVPLRRLISGTE